MAPGKVILDLGRDCYTSIGQNCYTFNGRRTAIIIIIIIIINHHLLHSTWIKARHRSIDYIADLPRTATGPEPVIMS